MKTFVVLIAVCGFAGGVQARNRGLYAVNAPAGCADDNDGTEAKRLLDGPWLVRSRSSPVQRIEDSGFPPGKDQWISAAGAIWAAMALALTLPVQRSGLDGRRAPSFLRKRFSNPADGLRGNAKIRSQHPLGNSRRNGRVGLEELQIAFPSRTLRVRTIRRSLAAAALCSPRRYAAAYPGTLSTSRSWDAGSIRRRSESSMASMKNSVGVPDAG